MPAAKTSFRLPDATLARLAALAALDAPDRPNMTATLTRLVLEAHRKAGLPDPGPVKEAAASPWDEPVAPIALGAGRPRRKAKAPMR